MRQSIVHVRDSCSVELASSRPTPLHSCRGRFLTAKNALDAQLDLFASPAYLTIIVPSWKKRVCRGCLGTSPARLSIRCTCNQCWYCSTACKEQHWSHGQAGAACQVPHSLTCPVLSLFGGSKCNADMESVLHMCLDALALQTLQQPASDEGHAGLQCSSEKQPDHSAFLQLQDHSADFSPEDMRDWLKACRFLRAALRKASWQGLEPSDQDIMSYIGRIVANNFGIYGCEGGRLHAGCHAASAGAAPAEAPGTCAGSQGAARTVHGSMAETTSNRLSCAADSIAQMQRQPGSNFRPSDTAEADERRCLPCAAPKPLPLWPLAAQQTSPGPGDAPSYTDPVPQHDACSSSGEAACGLHRLHMHENVAGPPMATATALLGCDSNASDSQRQMDASLQGHADKFDAAASQASSQQPEDGKSLQRPHELIGRELFITASMLNHSCAPNCMVLREAGHARIVTQALIEERAELTISYIDVNLPLSSRRRELQRNFFFLCTCSRCEREEVDGSEKQTYAKSSSAARTSYAPKKRGEKARTKRK